MKYAVNISDLTRDNILAKFLFTPFIRSKTIVDIEKGRLDGKAIIVDCDDKQWEGIEFIVRKHYDKGTFRLYKFDKKWRRI